MPTIFPFSATVTVGPSRVKVRAEPNTSAPLAGSQVLSPGVKFEVKGWTYGECVEGECRWWVSKFGNYVWAGGTIEKPPGSPTPPVTAPTPAPPTAAPTPTPTPTPIIPKPAPTPSPEQISKDVQRKLNFQKRINELIDQAIKGVHGIVGAREKILDIIKSEFPDLSELAQSIVYKQLPDTWEKTYGLIKEELPRGIHDPLEVLKELINKIIQNITSIAGRLETIFLELTSPKGLIWGTLNKLKTFFETAWNNLIEFFKDPIGKIKEGVGHFIGNVKNWIKEAIEVLRHIGENLWNSIKNGLENVKNWLAENVFLRLEAFWQRVKVSLSNTIHEIVDPIGDFLKWIWDSMKEFFKVHFFDPIRNLWYRMQIIWEDIKLTFTTIGIYISEFWNSTKLLFTKPGEFFKRWVTEIGQITSSETFRNIYSAVERAWDWLVGIFEKIVRAIIAEAKNFAPTAPEKGESLIESGIRLLGIATAGFGALTGVSMAVSWLSRHHLGHLSAILYDMSSYRLISAALIGGLVTAAYAQPLKYFYNATFRPYLPHFRDVFSAFSRNIIGKKEFQFHLKYAGIPDTYLELYDRLASSPISPFLLRGMAEAEIADVDTIFKYVMDRGYDIQKSIDITGSLMWLAIKDSRKAAEISVKKHLVEGYITLEDYRKEISRIRAKKEHPVSYSTIDGETFTGTVFVPLSHEELMQISAEWERKFDQLKGRERAIEADLKAGDIDADTARRELSEFIKDPGKIEDIIRRSIRERKVKEEPDRGKAIRAALKAKLRDNYKEGFITKEVYDSIREEVNKITDENILESMLAEWSAFFDDQMDKLKFYETQVLAKSITPQEFRQKLEQMGMRPSKIEIIYGRILERLAIEVRKKKEKLEGEIKRLKSRLASLQREIASLEEEISAETKESRLRSLLQKYQSRLEKASKVEEEIAAKEEQLKEILA
jgi:ElaB/YqjD/DUF883 family membrane-anchored ribosome-binding protein